MPSPSGPRVVDFYDLEGEVAERYNAESFWERRYHNRRYKAVARLLRMAAGPGDVFLDVGCGTGEYLHETASMDCMTIGLDLSLSYLERVRDEYDFACVRADATALPLGSRTVDVTLCSEVIEHLPHVHEAIEELCRVSRRFVIISTPHNGLIRRVGSRLFPKQTAALDDSVGHLHILTTEELLDVARMDDWVPVRMSTLHIMPPVVMETLRLPKQLSPLIDLLDRALQFLAPSRGNVSLLLLQRSTGDSEIGTGNPDS